MNANRLFVLIVSCCFSQACVTTTTTGARTPSDAEAAQANLNLGAAYLREGRPDLALERLERALVQNPRLADAHSTIALVYDQLGRSQEAEEHYLRATQLEPDNGAAANSYAVALCRRNRWSEAESYFRKAAQNPRYTTPAAALANAGVCARGAGDRMKAEEYFRAALTKDPEFADALMNMMEISYGDANYLQARAFMQRYLDVRPASAPVLWLCIQIEQQLDNAPAAEKCAAQLRESFPESAEVGELRELQGRDAGK